MEKERTEKLKYLLNISKEYKFIENEEGESFLKIKGYYETSKEIYINFTKLVALLEENHNQDNMLLDELD